MLIDKIVLSQDRTWCYVYLVDGETIKVDFKALNINYLEGLAVIYSWSESPSIAA